MIMKKLSEIWFMAAKELKRVEVSLGFAPNKTACALGAISYYLSEGETCHVGWLKGTKPDTFHELQDAFEKKSGHRIAELNDDKHWSFNRFAKKAQQLGL